MYIIWIGWLYVVLMFALGQRTLPMTVFVLILFGALPTWLLLFVVRRRQAMKANGDIAPRKPRRPRGGQSED
ncbi:hypothetical protein [Rivihabitans pingtungensis]|jgi:hypothetical protein|uniref:hypothetical protein n=1 Tax=Rivihabitans pingtungensis TaxID=1054498 RepID=UPI002357D426|nr:hypothetical protein [Rivihabitans pingtungensis]MCK6435835.1 hypothetical protein [Rivihabitans pingtungensis]